MYDDYFGALLIAEPPLNLLLIPLIPFFIFMRKPKLPNEIYTFIQYSLILSVMTVIFLWCSIVLIPFAYLKSIFLKVKRTSSSSSISQFLIHVVEFLVFLVMGIPSLFINVVTDLVFFIKFQFK